MISPSVSRVPVATWRGEGNALAGREPRNEHHPRDGGALGEKNHEHRIRPHFPALGRRLKRMRDDRRGLQTGEDRIFGFRDIRETLGSECQRAGLPRSLIIR